MPRVLTLWMLCVCTLMLPALAARAPAGRIVGMVTTRDAVSKPLDYANVHLESTARGAMARNGGRFSIDGVPAGTYSLKATFVGFVPQVIANLRVEPNATTVVKFCLQIELAGIVQTIVVDGGEIRCGCRLPEPIASSSAGKEFLAQARKSDQKNPTVDVVTLSPELRKPRCGRARSIPAVERTVPAARPVRPPTPLAPPVRVTEIAVTSSLSAEVEKELITCECGASRAPSSVIAAVEKNSEPGGEETALPKVTRLWGCTPNPFNPMTTIRFELASKGHVELQIYDARGRQVRRLLSREMEAGPNAVVWDGKTDAGRLVPCAVYFLRMEAGGLHARSKLMAIR